MRLIEFCPGEGSRYFAGVAVLTKLDARPLGGDAETVLITFGEEKDLSSGTFQCNPNKYGHLTPAYLKQYLPHLDAASLLAAHHVVAALLGREACFTKWSPEQLEWDKNWKVQLAPLMREIEIGLGRNASPDSTIARAIESAPELVEMARLLSIFEADDPELGEIARKAQKIVAYIDGGKPT